MKNGYIVTFEWLNRGEMDGYSWWESGYTFVSKLEDLKKYHKHVLTHKEGRRKNIKTHKNVKIYKVEEITLED